ncbi:hypothetical protein [Actinotalea solisilvae]|uniref:hypothetical protein n=1 Tax=Actinotalea solisilvae TaxID=2072922 RepID=UPI0018F10F84|nr:hypothetical protein [Actinotalea solisilvae]
MTAAVVAPAAPAAWGRSVEHAAMAAYLDALGAWRDARRRELDALDRVAVTSPDTDLTGDVTLAMALWQSVATRHDELVRVWDGGRVGAVELARLSALVWGRDPAGGAAGGAGGSAGTTGVSLPEACRLSDAVTAQLRRRLALETVSADLAGHLAALRAAVERIRDLVAAAPAGPASDDARARLARLDERVDDVTARARRGADVGGLVGPLEADVARAERDLIVAAATRRDDERDLARATSWRAALADRADAVAALADACVRQVVPAPVLGIPQVESLGAVPASAADVDAYLLRLDAVERALARAEDAYRAPVAELTDLRGLLAASRAQAGARGRDRYPEVADLGRHAAEVLAAEPVDLPRARAVVAAYRGLLDAPDPALPPAPTPTTSGRSS